MVNMLNTVPAKHHVSIVSIFAVLMIFQLLAFYSVWSFRLNSSRKTANVLMSQSNLVQSVSEQSLHSPLSMEQLQDLNYNPNNVSLVKLKTDAH